jgi:hypothetical protein
MPVYGILPRLDVVQIHALTGQILHGCGNLVRGDLKFETSYFVNQIQHGGGRGTFLVGERTPPRSVPKKSPSSTSMQNLPGQAMKMWFVMQAVLAVGGWRLAVERFSTRWLVRTGLVSV